MARRAAGAAVLLALPACTRTPPFTDERGRVLPNSIATMERIRLGGVQQSVWFRGRDRRAPVLILLHGGPGASESALFRRYDAALEQHFVVVYWDQRGTGRSFDADLPRDSLTIRRLLLDLDALVDTVSVRFGARQVVLLGHSWGTALGTLYAQAHPERVAAYVGVAQIADFAAGERLSLAWALRQAQARGDSGGLRTLCRMRPAPRSVADELALGRLVERYGGTNRSGPSTGGMIWASLRTDELGLLDLVRFGRGNRFSLTALRPEYATLELTRHREFATPVVFMLGRHDWHVPSVLAADYFATIRAPAKRLVWFERSAHNPPFEEPDAFVRAVVTHVLPLARGELPPPAPAAGALTAQDWRPGPTDDACPGA